MPSVTCMLLHGYSDFMYARQPAVMESVSVIDFSSAGAGRKNRAPARFHPVNLTLLLPAAFCAALVWKMDFIWLEAALLASVLAAVAIAGNRLTWTARPPAFCRRL